MRELREKLEKAKMELRKAYEMDDWDGILSLSMDVYEYQRAIEQAKGE